METKKELYMEYVALRRDLHRMYPNKYPLVIFKKEVAKYDDNRYSETELRNMVETASKDFKIEFENLRKELNK